MTRKLDGKDESNTKERNYKPEEYRTLNDLNFHHGKKFLGQYSRYLSVKNFCEAI